MRRIIALTTAVVLLLHSVLGCCWHHAHASEFGGCGQDLLTHDGTCSADEDGHERDRDSCPGDSLLDSHLPSDGPASDPPGEPTPCDEGPCFFARTDTPARPHEIGGSGSVVWQGASAVAMAPECPAASTADGAWFLDAASSLRPHLLHQVWLL